MKLKNLLVGIVLTLLGGSLLAQPPAKGLDSKYIAANYYKGVVKILLVDSAIEKSNPSKPGSGYIGRGSGFFVTEDGVIFTNRHVVEYCVKGYIDYDYKDETGTTRSAVDPYSDELVNSPGFVKAYRTGYTTPIVQVYHGKGEADYTLYVAKVLTMGTGSFDGAVLKIVSDIKGQPVYTKFFPLPIGNSDAAQQGEDLCVFGFPAQYDGEFDTHKKDMSTLTFGKFSGLDYVFNKDYGYIKTDAQINGGNSGGPVFNESNKVIGIATAVGNKTGIGLVGGVNGMYYIVAPKSDILTKLTVKGLTIPKNAGSINTIMGDRLPIKDASQLGGGNSNYSNNNNKNSNNNSGSDDPYTKSKVSINLGLNEETGSLGEEVTSVDISPNGSYVWVVVTNKPNTLNSLGLIMDVYTKDGGDYKLLETKEYDLSKTSLQTTYFKYSIYKAGDYKFKIYNKESKWINDAFLSVDVTGGDNNKNGGKDDPYSESEVYVSLGLNENTGYLGEKTDAVDINANKGSYVWIVVTNKPNTLNTLGLIMDIYRKDGGDYKLYETKEYDLSKKTLQTTYFKYSIYKKGDYKFKVYSKESKFINQALLNVGYQ
ncbi:MAG: trypsin-like peptidase domain-containing protein [Bacteroidia bacterium]|nr:trypsin-like peptidase domain-containing protein [Bacteroidia bacterium]